MAIRTPAEQKRITAAAAAASVAFVIVIIATVITADNGDASETDSRGRRFSIHRLIEQEREWRGHDFHLSNTCCCPGRRPPTLTTLMSISLGFVFSKERSDTFFWLPSPPLAFQGFIFSHTSISTLMQRTELDRPISDFAHAPSHSGVMMICHFNFPFSLKYAAGSLPPTPLPKASTFWPRALARTDGRASSIVGISRNARLFLADRSVVKTAKTMLLLS